MCRGAEDFGSSSSQEKSKIEVQKVEGVVKPNVSPSKKKENKDGKDGERADGDTAKKKGKEKDDQVRLLSTCLWEAGCGIRATNLR